MSSKYVLIAGVNRAEKDDFVVCFYRNLGEIWNGNQQVTGKPTAKPIAEKYK